MAVRRKMRVPLSKAVRHKMPGRRTPGRRMLVRRRMLARHRMLLRHRMLAHRKVVAAAALATVRMLPQAAVLAAVLAAAQMPWPIPSVSL
jgi:hypothetical protein